MSRQKIKNVMSTDVATVRTDTPFKEIVRTLEQRDISAVPVVDAGGRVLGVVSQADLLAKRGAQEPTYSRSPLARLLHRRADRLVAARTAAQLMTTPAITIDAESTVARAARVLARNDIVEQVFERGIGLAVNPATVTITVDDGEVTIDGQIQLKSQIPLVEQMTRHLDGVVDVTTSLTYVHDDTHTRIPDPMSFEPGLR